MSNSINDIIAVTELKIQAIDALRLPDAYIRSLVKSQHLVLCDTDSSAVLYMGEFYRADKAIRNMWLDYLANVNEYNKKNQKSKLACMNFRDFSFAFDRWRDNNIRQARLELIERLKYDGSDPLKVLDQWLMLVAGEVREKDRGAILHSLWCVKRLMLGLETGYEIMVILVGGLQQAGKNTAMMKGLLKPLSQFSYSLRMDELTDSRWTESLENHYVGFIDEMAGADKAQITVLKSRVRGERKIAFKPLYTNTVVQVQNNCTFFAGSNIEVKSIINDPTGMSRWYELMVRAGVIDKDAIRLLDYDQLWRGVDENRQWGYYEEYKNHFESAQKELEEDANTFASWCTSISLAPPDGNSGEWLNVEDLYKSYVDFAERMGDERYHWGMKMFCTHLKAKSFDKKRTTMCGKKVTAYFCNKVQIAKDHSQLMDEPIDEKTKKEKNAFQLF